MKPPKSVAVRVAVGLYHFAHGGSYYTTGHALDIGESTAHTMVWEFITAVLKEHSDRISWPADDATREHVAKGFESKHQLPNCQGAIDCSHFSIRAPDNEESRSYVDRHGKYSVTVQAVVDGQGRFLNVFAGWPGSCHDNRIFRSSCLYEAIKKGDVLHSPVAMIEGKKVMPWLVGDAGYTLEPWMIVPYPGTRLTIDQDDFNYWQSGTRICVEQAFGRLKNRFRWLGQTMHVADSTKFADVITVACILHNIMMDHTDLYDEEYDHGAELQHGPAPAPAGGDASETGKSMRDTLCAHARRVLGPDAHRPRRT